MKKQKPLTAVEQVRQRQVADRVARARAEKRDPTGVHHAAICDLARETGRDPVDLLDLFDERAAIREYEGGTTRVAAEAAAVDDVRSIVTVQRKMAV